VVTSLVEYLKQLYGKALEILEKELILDPSSERAAYRSTLLGAFLYKALLSLLPKDAVPAPLRSAITEVAFITTQYNIYICGCKP